MILNKEYYQQLWEKFKNTNTLGVFNDNASCLTTKLILEHYSQNKPVHFNFQNSKETIFEIGKHLFIELANDIYCNQYDLPDNYNVGDKLKRIRDNQYYEIVKVENDNYSLRQVLRKTKIEISPALLSGINYDRLTKHFLEVNAGKGISEKTIKNYIAFFEELNKEKNEFPKTNFEKKTVFIAKKPLWDSLPNRNKIPCAYLPNPREENNATETRSIPALQDCLAYFTPKYEVCYSNILSKNEKVKTIVVFDTEAEKIEQMISDKNRFGFNLIILSNSELNKLIKSESIPCWNWFKEEIEIVNAL
ncbi:MAG: hypothetical protein IPH58_04680 [Sphingobacteriales bacterium]|jgi:hypothetical protein|nr:hypothetical protein [Sphingobacteriales bacterium]